MMLWRDNLEEFCNWCVETRNVERFKQALVSVPADAWRDVEMDLVWRLSAHLDRNRHAVTTAEAPEMAEGDASSDQATDVDRVDAVENGWVQAEKWQVFQAELLRRIQR